MEMNEDTYKNWEEQATSEIKVLENEIKKIDKDVKKQIEEAREKRDEIKKKIRRKKSTLERIKKNCNQLITGKIPERKKKMKLPEVKEEKIEEIKLLG